MNCGVGGQEAFERAKCAAAEAALGGLSEYARVQFALRLILNASEPAVAGALSFAANRIGEHAHILMREAIARECG